VKLIQLNNTVQILGEFDELDAEVLGVGSRAGRDAALESVKEDLAKDDSSTASAENLSKAFRIAYFRECWRTLSMMHACWMQFASQRGGPAFLSKVNAEFMTPSLLGAGEDEVGEKRLILRTSVHILNK
jgi:hypothetical protein